MAIRYPSQFTVNSPGTDYIEIKAIRRDYSSEDEKYLDAGLGTLILNVPQKVVENYTQSWANTKLGEIGPFLGMRNQTSPGPMNSGPFTNFGPNMGKRLLEQMALNQATDVLQKFGSENLGPNGLLSGASGIIFNPNMEVLYDGPQFRQYNFQFAMATKSKDDAYVIYKIVEFFKKASVPSRNATPDAGALGSLFADVSSAAVATGTVNSVSGALGDLLSGKSGNSTVGSIVNQFLPSAGQILTAGGAASGAIFSGQGRFIKQPPFIQLRFRRGSDEHPYVSSLLPAAITSMSVDYTPTGNYTVLNNFGETQKATTVATTITLTLTEIKNVFSEDIDNDFTSGNYPLTGN